MRYNKKKLILAVFFPVVLVATIILYCFPQKTAGEYNTQQIMDKVSIRVGDTTMVIDCGPIPGSQEGYYIEEEDITKDTNDMK